MREIRSDYLFLVAGEEIGDTGWLRMGLDTVLKDFCAITMINVGFRL